MEIDAKELRIGNYYDNNGGISQVTPDVIENVWVAKRQWVQGIPLTEEWLLKFGFEKEGEIMRLNLDDDETYLEYCPANTDLICTIVNDKYDWSEMVGNITYQVVMNSTHVHQLQNLYFALTNEELTIK